MRVLKPGRDRYIIVEDRGEIIEKKLIKRLNPSEMIELKLKKDGFKKAKELKELLVYVR